MAWSNSKIFQAFITDMANNTAAFDINTDTLKVPLFDNTVTPDRTVTSANSAYGAGVWASGGVTDTGSSAPAGWPAAGLAATVATSAASAGTYTMDFNDLPSANSVTTLASVYGCLVYEDTLASPVADQGICFNYFGGTNSVTLGTFTIVWNASGVLTITV